MESDMGVLNSLRQNRPGRWHCVLPGNAEYRFESGSLAELGFTLLLALAAITLAPMAQSGLGTTDLIRQAVGHIDDASSQYRASFP
ncbi:MAG: hypothetical protein HQL48_11270 [Gammaproteobacteria bacterium]|nr:hypothetical protein [Gammaproteobacteria bacterium]